MILSDTGDVVHDMSGNGRDGSVHDAVLFLYCFCTVWCCFVLFLDCFVLFCTVILLKMMEMIGLERGHAAV